MLKINSRERHEARYQRRKAARMAKKEASACGRKFEEVITFENMVRAGHNCCSGCRWKTSTLNFEHNLLSECLTVQRAVENNDYNFRGFYGFTTFEHGKKREINSLHIQDRTLQKCLCENLLTEAYSRSFIYDNSSSLPGKGMHFALRRIKKHLRDHYLKFGLEGGIYQYDFSSYFNSLPHAGIKERGRKIILDDRLYALFCDLVDEFTVMKGASGAPYGVGLGSEVSQAIALDYASPIDHYFKDFLGVKGYGRYMDDGYIISNDMNALKQFDADLHRLAEQLGIKMNTKKCVITPFKSHSFTLLKMRFTLTKTGKIVMKLSRRSIKTMRRKIKAFRKWVGSKRMSFTDALQSYQAWRAYACIGDSFRTLQNMDAYFIETFKAELETYKKEFKCTLGVFNSGRKWDYYLRNGGCMIWNT